jgi:hypothetical protein
VRPTYAEVHAWRQLGAGELPWGSLVEQVVSTVVTPAENHACAGELGYSCFVY